MSKMIVDANYRYIAAYQEVNARISQRQQALALYITLVVSLLAAIVALQGRGSIAIEWLLLGFPVASVCLAFLNYKAERAITNLRRFLSVLEQLGAAHEQLPSYNTHPTWAQGANKARRFHDYAAAVLVLGGNGAGLGAALHIYPDRLADAPLALWTALLFTLLSIAVLLIIPRWSYTPETPPKATGQHPG